jgi:hypothetical protein
MAWSPELVTPSVQLPTLPHPAWPVQTALASVGNGGPPGRDSCVRLWSGEVFPFDTGLLPGPSRAWDPVDRP